MRRRDASQIVATATLPTCVGVSRPSFVFRWYIRATEARQTQGAFAPRNNDLEWVEIDPGMDTFGQTNAVVSVKRGFHFADNRRAVLLVKPFTWLPCLRYELKVVVHFASSGGNRSVSNFQTAVVEQARGQVHAIIDAVDTIITADQPLSLNASSSYDEDGLSPDVDLVFAWECTSLVTGKACGVDALGWTSHALQLPPGTLPVRSRVRFSVTVSSNAHSVFPCYSKKPRRATDWVVVTVKDIPAPNIRVQVCTVPACTKPIPVVQGRAAVNFRPSQSYYLRMSAAMPLVVHGEGSTHDQLTAQCGAALESRWFASIEPPAASIDTQPLTQPHRMPLAGTETFKFTLGDSPRITTAGAGYKFIMQVYKHTIEEI